MNALKQVYRVLWRVAFGDEFDGGGKVFGDAGLLQERTFARDAFGDSFTVFGQQALG